MAWSTIFSTVVTASVALVGVGYGARLSGRRETLNWTREQRLKTYTDILTAVENCYHAFTLIAVGLEIREYKPGASQDPGVAANIADWDKWSAEIDNRLPAAEMVASKSLDPYIASIRLGLRSRHRVLLMKLHWGKDPIDGKERKAVSSMTHREILDIRRRFRDDVTHVDPAPTRFRSAVQRVTTWWPKRRAKLMMRREGEQPRGVKTGLTSLPLPSEEPDHHS